MKGVQNEKKVQPDLNYSSTLTVQVIPKELKTTELHLLHTGHNGYTKYFAEVKPFFCREMESEIEKTVNNAAQELQQVRS